VNLMRCPNCDGSGKVHQLGSLRPVDCYMCVGKGQIVDMRSDTEPGPPSSPATERDKAVDEFNAPLESYQRAMGWLAHGDSLNHPDGRVDISIAAYVRCLCVLALQVYRDTYGFSDDEVKGASS
jgi:hypothetical protein